MLPTFRWIRTWMPILTVLTMLAAGNAAAAPYDGQPFTLRQPDGEAVDVLVWGDEYYQHVEDPEGFTLVRDPASDVICYARLDAAGRALISTGVRVGDPAVNALGLARHLALPPRVRREQALATRRLLDVELADLNARGDSRDPQPSCLGEVQGITLIIDFSDQVGTVPASAFAAYLNDPGYTGFGNNGSVRDYFYDVSDGALTYTNYAPTAYFRASHPKTYYDDPNITYGQRARELVREALINLNNSGFDFSQYDANGDGYVDALNVFYAGVPDHGWSLGLWPHSSVVSYYADGVSTYRYQITNIGTTLALSTFCHENGHMICFWPDLYDYGGESAGVGAFCLMCSSGAGTNPTQPCAPLKDIAGWTVSLTTLSGFMNSQSVTSSSNQFYKLPHPTLANEYYLIENRQRTGRDQAIPDAGLSIWHVDLYGSNNNQEQTPSSHYHTTLVQADGRWDLEHDRNNGDTTDLWSAPTHVEFSPQTNPRATWWDGTAAAMFLDGIGVSGATMTFNFRETLGNMTVAIAVEPAGLPASWRLEGPGGYLETGSGDRSLLVWDEGLYTLTWLPLPGWTTPDPAVAQGELVNGGVPLSFHGAYTDPPFMARADGPLADAGPGRGASLVDSDGDGDLDLYVCNRGSANRLLRNDGDLSFVDVATGPLAETGPTMAATWTDFDNDNDQDAYLVRDGASNLLLEQQPDGTFLDIAQFGTENTGAGRAAAWCDYDSDGRLDLYLVNSGSANQLFRSYGDIGIGHFAFFATSFPALQDAGDGTAASWGDFDLDGDLDVYLVNAWQANFLVANLNGTMFEVQPSLPDVSNGQAAAWGDVDGDGDFDLYLVNDGQADVLFRHDAGYFTPLSGPGLGDTGRGRGVVLADLDNDGNLDIFVARHGTSPLLAFGQGDGQFAVSALTVADAGGLNTSVACGDLDGDGGLDLYVCRDNQANVLLHNTLASRGHWLHVDLQGDATNRDAIGARVRVVAGGRTQLRQVTAGGDGLSQQARQVAFGLGAATVVDSLIVHWPAGATRVYTGLAADRSITLQETGATAAPTVAAPLATRLLPAQPNPFNPSTQLTFELSQAGLVDVAVFALDGRRVATLAHEERPAGRHLLAWRGTDDAGRALSSGTYICRLTTAQGHATQRLTLVK